jgi:hypothetical protein
VMIRRWTEVSFRSLNFSSKDVSLVERDVAIILYLSSLVMLGRKAAAALPPSTRRLKDARAQKTAVSRNRPNKIDDDDMVSDLLLVCSEGRVSDIHSSVVLMHEEV